MPQHPIMAVTMIIEHAARRTVVCVATILVASFLAVPPAQANGRTATEEARLGMCIKRAAGGRGWLEKTLWGLRDKEAGWVGAQIPNADGSQDLGPLQINSWWVGRIAALTGRPEAHVRYWLVYDACFNVDAARWIFLTGLTVTGDYWKAIGVYHSPTVWRQQRYAISVSTHLKRRFGPSVFAAGATAPAVRP